MTPLSMPLSIFLSLALTLAAIQTPAPISDPEQRGATEQAAAESVQDPVADEPESGTPPTRPFPDRILQQLLEEREQTRPDQPAPPPQDASRELDRQGVLLEGTRIVSRPVEVFDQDGVIQLVLSLPERTRRPMLEPLENSVRQQMEQEFARGATRFIVSGEVTRYQGRNYLLLRRASPRGDHGNLRP